MTETSAQHEKAAGSAFEILYSPGRAAAAAARAGMWLPLVILGITAAIADYPMIVRFGPTALVDIRLEQTPSGLSTITVLFFLVSQYASPVLLPLAVCVLGLFMAFLLAFLLDAGVKRRQVLAVTAWAFLPVAFERTVTGVFRALRVNPDANPFNPFASNLGFFFDSTRMRPFWYEVACGTDAFLIASVFLAGLALAALSKKPAAALVAALVVGCALGILVRAALLT